MKWINQKHFFFWQVVNFSYLEVAEKTLTKKPEQCVHFQFSIRKIFFGKEILPQGWRKVIREVPVMIAASMILSSKVSFPSLKLSRPTSQNPHLCARSSKYECRNSSNTSKSCQFVAQHPPSSIHFP